MHQRLEKQQATGLGALLLLPVFLLLATSGGPPGPGIESAATPSSYIVQAASAAEAERLVVRAGGEVTATLTIINAVGANLNEEQVAWLRSRAGRIKVYADATLNVSGAVAETDYPTLIGAATLHEQGITGNNITIAVLDTGLWQTRATKYSARGRRRILAQYDATLTLRYCSDDCEDDEAAD